jgi:hypothetical protein
MTRKDYIKFAALINAEYAWTKAVAGDEAKRVQGVLDNLIDSMSGVFASDNANFDRARFVTACTNGKGARS